MKLKKIIKIILGAIVFLTLPTLLFFGFLYFKYNEELPTGIQGEHADVFAKKMLSALNENVFKATDTIEFTFKKRHHYNWYKTQNTCDVYWKNYKVQLNLKTPKTSSVYIDEVYFEGEEKNELITKALNYFNNDTFWLVAPYKVFDAGTQRRLVTLDDNTKALLITYTSGGSTPGDSYLWFTDSTGMPTHYKMWTSILPIKGLKSSWSDWTTTESGAKLPTFHNILALGIEIENIKGY